MQPKQIAELRDAVGDCPDVTVVLHEDGATAPTLALPEDGGTAAALEQIRTTLSDRRFSELGVDELASASGRLALLVSDGGPSAAWALAVAELRFERVIVVLTGPDVSLEAARESVERARLGRPTATTKLAAGVVLLVEQDVELTGEASVQLLAELQAHPEALAVAAAVRERDGAGRDGAMRVGGGELREWDGVVEFRATDHSSEWISGGAVAVRESALAQLPLDPAMGAYALREWSYRIAQHPPVQHPADQLRRSADALAVDHAPETTHPTQVTARAGFVERCRALPALCSIARFHSLHGAVITDVFEILPGLVDHDGKRDVPAARAVLTLLEHAGPERFLELWAGGALDRLLVESHERRLENELSGAQARLDFVGRRLATIESTRAWRLVTACYRLRDAVRRRL